MPHPADPLAATARSAGGAVMDDKETMRRVAGRFGYTDAEFEVMWLLYVAGKESRNVND